jgi:hypothetical protein
VPRVRSYQEALARQIDVGQTQRDERPGRFLGQVAIEHLAEAPGPLDDSEGMLDACARLGLCAIEGANEFCGCAAGTDPLAGLILRLRRLRLIKCLLRCVGAVAVQLLLGPVQPQRALRPC